MFASRFARLALLAAPTFILGSESGKYDYHTDSPYGPSNWGSLPIDHNSCNGKKNSPIAVETSACDVKADYIFTNGDCTIADMTFAISSGGVKAEYSGDCTKDTIQIPGVDGTYEALQFHIHLSSEHTIDGEYFGAELHIVHKQTDGDRYAVVGMMLDAKNPENHGTFEYFVEGWTAISKQTAQTCITSSRLGGKRVRERDRRNLQQFDAYSLVPKGSSFYHYDGGLTTPPCSEVVWWNLADTTVSISVAQYSHLTKFIMEYRNSTTCELASIASDSGSTSRPVQALNGRVVTRICPTTYLEPSGKGSKDGKGSKGGKGSKNGK